MTGFNGLGPAPPAIVRGIINPDAAPSDALVLVFVLVLVLVCREPVLDPSLSEVAGGEPLTDAIKIWGKQEHSYFQKSKLNIKF